MTEIRIATRRSRLALRQSAIVAQRLRELNRGLTVTLVEITTSGDLDRESSVVDLTEVGAFVRAVQQAVLEGSADVAVHSAKDLPTMSPPGLELVAFPERASPFDVLVGGSLDELPRGAVVGTGSPRRSEQLLELRADLRPVPIRGNVDTRLKKVTAGEVSAVVLAEAGLVRLARASQISHRFDREQMVPAPGQGALAVEARPGTAAAAWVALIDDPSVRTAVTAERMLLAETGAGCRAALGALATAVNGSVQMTAFVADDRGRRRAFSIADSPESVVAEIRQELAL